MKQIISTILIMFVFVVFAVFGFANETNQENEPELNETSQEETNEDNLNQNDDDEENMNENNEKLNSEDVEETKIMNTPYGAKVRLIQLQKSIEKNLESGLLIIEEVDNQETKEKLNDILKEMEILNAKVIEMIDEVEDNDKTTAEITKEFVYIKSEARKLTMEFKTITRSYFTEQKQKELRTKLQEENKNRIEEHKKQIEQARLEYNLKNLEHLSEKFNLTHLELSQKVRDNEITLQEARKILAEEISKINKEKRNDIASKIKEEIAKKEVERRQMAEQLRAELAEKLKEREQERKEMAEKLRSELAEKMEQRKQVGKEVSEKIRNELTDKLNQVIENKKNNSDKLNCNCQDIYKPVCGVDGITYGNECKARCQNIKIDYEGECRNNLNEDNLSNESNCNCQDIYKPVCGVDGITYGNECKARCQNIKIDYEGECRIINDNLNNGPNLNINLSSDVSDCEISIVDSQSLETLLNCLEPFIREKGYVSDYSESTLSQTNVNYNYGSSRAGSIYFVARGEVHIIGHHLGGDKALTTKFLQFSEVTPEIVLDSFK
jgi:hypothetical protein